MSEATASQVFTSGRIGGLRLRNRFIRSAAFEGMCPDGEPSSALVRHHRELAAGGVGMTTVAYAAVAHSGRSYPHQLCLWKPGTLPGLRRLTEAVHAQGAAVSLQLAHAGYCADPVLAGGTAIAPSVVFNRYALAFPRAMTDEDMATVIEEFGRAASVAVEIHAAHGYPMSVRPSRSRSSSLVASAPYRGWRRSSGMASSSSPWHDRSSPSRIWCADSRRVRPCGLGASRATGASPPLPEAR